MRQSEHLADRVARESPDVPSQIDLAYRLVLQRPPSAAEAELLVAYANKHGMAGVCRIIFNSNEFMFVD